MDEPPPPPPCEAEATYERLAALAPVCGSCLEPLVSGFVQDPGFRQELQDFILARAPHFLVLCEDGSHPLVWKIYHDEYRAIFERQMQPPGEKALESMGGLRTILQALGLSALELTDLCAWLRSSNGHGFQLDDGIGAFLEAVTACEEYENFLSVMFAEVARQADDTLEVQVPAHLQPGDAFEVAYLGVCYNLQIPECHAPGDVLRVTVNKPHKLDVVSLFNVPDSFYGLD
ncbi:unnamed protein product [Effrenium voratum]|uniref:Uncharacterized protein n=1 Tax=Effrenium voratum TaxID=2562239 RepID=A0AA36NC49_9DINO|nr:unnamed protein product [Effrenium voratum]